ncbi:Tfp pilus assembly protein FimT/FimU [Marinobacter sp. LN3S78]|uniref:pilus assembly FimT family protein n=1 Tax=Marinobacter sp. LN3S78 TaxID=3382300 RepID=UPI00387AD864
MELQRVPDMEGFTLVELVMVIILIGVLSALGIGLFARSSSFSPLLATQQLESATLLAQQAALAGNPNPKLAISVSGDSLDLSAAGSESSIEHYGAEVNYRLISDDGSASSWGSADGLEIPFDQLGNLSGPIAGQSVELQISGESNFLVCLNALGALYRGKCP